MITLVMNEEVFTYRNPIHIQFINDFVNAGIELVHYNGKPAVKVDSPFTALCSTRIPIKYFKAENCYLAFPKD